MDMELPIDIAVIKAFPHGAQITRKGQGNELDTRFAVTPKLVFTKWIVRRNRIRDLFGKSG